MKRPNRAALPALLAAWPILAACGIPLVPDSASIRDAGITANMILVMECRLLDVGPDLPDPTLGPEPDVMPLLVPRPEAPATEAFLVLPQVAGPGGRRLFDLDSAPAPWIDPECALVFGLRLSSANSDHSVAFADTWRQARASVVPLPLPATGQHRFDLGIYRPTGRASRLVLGNAGLSGGRTILSAVEFPAAVLSDLPVAAAGSDAGFHTAGAFRLNAWQYQPADASSAALPWIDLNAAWPAASGAPPWQAWTGGCLFALPLGERFLTVYHNSTDPAQASDSLQLGFLQPWQDAAQPQAAAFTSTPMAPLTAAAFAGLPSGFFAGAFTTWNPVRFNGFLTIAGSQPDASGRYRCFYSWKKLGNWQLAGPFPTDWPPVRALADGSLLSLRDGQWSRARFGSGGTVSATSDGSTLPTGTLQFLYETIESDGAWMYFSQAFPVPGLPGRKDSLVLRAWKIREADFLATAR